MHAASTSARRARANHRQSLHTLTYVVLDEANGGIVRNLNHQGVAVHAVGALRLNQRVRVRFELRPRLRLDCQGEVAWADPSGQCGIRFLDLPPSMVRQINEWIFADLLDSIPSRTNSMFGATADARGETARAEPADDETSEIEADGLLLSSGVRKVIQLQPQSPDRQPGPHGVSPEKIAPLPSDDPAPALDWLSRPVAGRQIAWALNSLIVVAASLLFSLVFLAVTQDPPRWPLDLEAGFGAVIFVITFYWLFFRVLGGTSMGARLARLAESNARGDQDARVSARFR